ncbi:MAG: class I SAM-dependent methyltransferase [Candidatus Zixiibacteriota bacterium]|nr:MAG: class I SAM-dependent methyltransferase [candidate division Zixibacteria bacterium]
MKKPRPTSFFDVYAHEYDFLTDAAGREATHRKEVQAIIEAFRPRSVLDAGCATGLTARLFAENRIATVGLDRSKAILDIARSKHNKYNTILRFIVGDFEKLPQALHGQFDLVVCLANSIAGVGTIGGLRRSLENFHRALKPGGWLVLQLLNYSAIREGEVLPIRATEHKGIVYERFSERKGRRLFLYVTRLDTRAKPPGLEVFRHEFDNFSPAEVSRGLRRAGFGHLRRYGDLYLREKFAKLSRDLVITARRAPR